MLFNRSQEIGRGPFFQSPQREIPYKWERSITCVLGTVKAPPGQATVGSHQFSQLTSFTPLCVPAIINPVRSLRVLQCLTLDSMTSSFTASTHFLLGNNSCVGRGNPPGHHRNTVPQPVPCSQPLVWANRTPQPTRKVSL